MNVARPAAGEPPTVVPTSASGQRVADTYDGQSVALLTQHGKEQVIAPLLQKDLVARLRPLCPACGAPSTVQPSTACSRNRWLWLSLAAVHWAPAQAIFRTTDLAAAVASSVLVLDEARKLASHARRQPSHSAR